MNGEMRYFTAVFAWDITKGADIICGTWLVVLNRQEEKYFKSRIKSNFKRNPKSPKSQIRNGEDFRSNLFPFLHTLLLKGGFPSSLSLSSLAKIGLVLFHYLLPLKIPLSPFFLQILFFYGKSEDVEKEDYC